VLIVLVDTNATPPASGTHGHQRVRHIVCDDIDTLDESLHDRDNQTWKIRTARILCRPPGWLRELTPSLVKALPR
jgi:hypothetical protein